jgi:hypothetical protein
MEIKYDALWYDEKGNTRISHGTITEADFQEIIERKERDEWAGAEGMDFDVANIDTFKL